MLNNEYFSSLALTLKKRKYYDAAEVDRILSDIRSRAEAMISENARLQGQLDILRLNNDEISGSLVSAREDAKRITEEAKLEAEETIAEAKAKSAAILEAAELAQNELVQRAEKCFSSLREKHTEAIDGLNADFQEFLISLYPEDKDVGSKSFFDF